MPPACGSFRPFATARRLAFSLARDEAVRDRGTGYWRASRSGRRSRADRGQARAGATHRLHPCDLALLLATGILRARPARLWRGQGRTLPATRNFRQTARPCPAPAGRPRNKGCLRPRGRHADEIFLPAPLAVLPARAAVLL